MAMSSSREKTQAEWPQLSPRIRDLLRLGAEKVLNAPDEWFEELDEVTLSQKGYMAGDPVLIARTRRHNRLNVRHWAAANVKAPGAPVPPNIGPEMPNAARDLIRRGATESALNLYRAGQNWAWGKWINIVFNLTGDPKELHELLQFSAISIADFIDATIEALTQQMAKERSELLRGNQAEYRDVIKLILNHAPISPQVAGRRLGYRLDQMHSAAVVWGEDALPDSGHLDGAVEVLLQAANAPRALTVAADSATRWVWILGGWPDLTRIRQELSPLVTVRIAFGTAGRDIEGFRRSHWEAVTAQRILSRSESLERLVDYDSVRLLALMIPDRGRIQEFLDHTLGDLLTAEPLLRQSVHTFLALGCNIARAALVLGLHRNTLVRHLERAEELLPKPFDDTRIAVGTALEVLRWLAPAKERQHS
jgi:DNA-binding PucR family transcriptional regulator